MKRTLVSNGLLVDGTGRPARTCDVLVEDGRVVDLLPHEASGLAIRDVDVALDATGCLVTPGFIDAHAHSDAYLILEPDAPSKVMQGVTTEVNGQCGGSAAPRYGEARLAPDWAALLGTRLTWRSFAEYRSALDGVRPGVNVVPFVGHNTIRSSAIGYAARQATSDEIRAMERLVEQALDEGAWGLTTGLLYQPGRYASSQEVVALARTTARRGGFYATHMRSEGDGLMASVDEVLSLVHATGIRAEISHLKTSGLANWHKIDDLIERIETAVAAGDLLGCDRYPYCAAGTDLDVVLPDWAQEGASRGECARLADPVTRRKIIDELDASGRDWSAVRVGGTWHAENRSCSGQTIASLATHGRTPGLVVCDLLQRDGCKTGAFFFTMCEENLSKILACPWTVPGSDASLRAPWGPLGADHPHPRAYGTMPEFYWRLRSIGIAREQAVARMTAIPARRFGLNRRGTIEKGNWADLVVWNETMFRSRSTYDMPHAFADGVRHVMVNGVLTVRDGALTGCRGGQVLERGCR